MGVERQRELRRRRHRRKKLQELHRKVSQPGAVDPARVAEKLRRMTPGAEELIASWGLGRRTS